MTLVEHFEECFKQDLIQEFFILQPKPKEYDISPRLMGSWLHTVTTVPIHFDKEKQERAIQLTMTAKMTISKTILLADVIYLQTYVFKEKFIHHNVSIWSKEWMKFGFNNLQKVFQREVNKTYLKGQHIRDREEALFNAANNFAINISSINN